MKEEDDSELIRFIEALLIYCGECVQKGCMKSFKGKYQDSRIVKRKLENSQQYKGMLKSVADMRELAGQSNDVFNN